METLTIKKKSIIIFIIAILIIVGLIGYHTMNANSVADSENHKVVLETSLGKIVIALS